MRRNFYTLLLILALPPFPTIAADDELPRIEFLEMYPEEGTLLHAGEPLYVHFKYQSEEPLRFQLEGIYQREQVKKSASYNPGPAYPAGMFGEAMAWIAYSDKVDIDDLQLYIYDAKWDLIRYVSLNVKMSWSGRPSKIWQQPADWVRRLNTEQQAMTAGPPEQPPLKNLPLWPWLLALSIVVLLLIGWWLKGDTEE